MKWGRGSRVVQVEISRYVLLSLYLSLYIRIYTFYSPQLSGAPSTEGSLYLVSVTVHISSNVVAHLNVYLAGNFIERGTSMIPSMRDLKYERDLDSFHSAHVVEENLGKCKNK